jgi:hypothetical protein
MKNRKRGVWSVEEEAFASTGRTRVAAKNVEGARIVITEGSRVNAKSALGQVYARIIA